MPSALERIREAGLGEARDGEDTVLYAGRVAGPADASRERGAHLAAGPEHDHVAGQSPRETNVGGRRPGQQLLELGLVAHDVGEGESRAHRRFPREGGEGASGVAPAPTGGSGNHAAMGRI